jgi:ankyrin repeat protein
MVEFLLSIGSKISATNNNCDTPLHIAASKDKVEIACKLLDNGANLLALNALLGRTPADVAGTQKVAIAILAYTLGTMSHEYARLSQEVQDHINLVMATALYGNIPK